MSGITLTEVDDATIATPAAGKATVFMDDTLGPAYKDDGGSVHSLQGADGQLEYDNHGNTSTTETVDVSADQIHRLVLDANCTITLSNAPASGTPGIVRIMLVQDGTGGRTVTWPGSVVWKNSTAPVLQTAANAVDFVDLLTVDGGTTYYGSQPGERGLAGGAIAIPYNFSTTTTDSDPGAGNLRFDNATTASATKIRVDLVSSDGTTWTSVIDSLDDSTNTVKGHVRLFKTTDPTKWWLGTVSAVDSSSGYRNITVAFVAQSGASPFAAADPVTLVFTRTGDVGASGTASVATDPIWDAAGDLAVGSGADTAARLAIGATNGMALRRVSGAVAWDLPPGHEFDYAQITSSVNITSTNEASPDNVISGNAVTYDGSTAVWIEFWAHDMEVDNGASGRFVYLLLFDGSSSIGRIALMRTPAAGDLNWPVIGRRKITPSAAAHTYHIKGFVNAGTSTIGAGAGGAGDEMPAYIRIVKA